jgi:hypothetical protein
MANSPDLSGFNLLDAIGRQLLRADEEEPRFSPFLPDFEAQNAPGCYRSGQKNQENGID